MTVRRGHGVGDPKRARDLRVGKVMGIRKSSGYGSQGVGFRGGQWV